MLTTIEPFTILTVDSGVLDYLHRLIYSKYVQYGARLAPQTEPIHEAHFDMLHRALISIEDARGLQHTVMRQPPAKAPEKTAPRRIKKVDASAAPPPRRLIRRDPPGERPSK